MLAILMMMMTGTSHPLEIPAGLGGIVPWIRSKIGLVVEDMHERCEWRVVDRGIIVRRSGCVGRSKTAIRRPLTRLMIVAPATSRRYTIHTVHNNKV